MVFVKNYLERLYFTEKYNFRLFKDNSDEIRSNINLKTIPDFNLKLISLQNDKVLNEMKSH